MKQKWKPYNTNDERSEEHAYDFSLNGASPKISPLVLF